MHNIITTMQQGRVLNVKNVKLDYSLRLLMVIYLHAVQFPPLSICVFREKKKQQQKQKNNTQYSHTWFLHTCTSLVEDPPLFCITHTVTLKVPLKKNLPTGSQTSVKSLTKSFKANHLTRKVILSPSLSPTPQCKYSTRG